MATYATNLSTVSLCDAATGWTELASPHGSGSAPASDTENYIHNSNSVSQATGQSTGTGAGIEFDNGSALSGWTATSNWVVMFWSFYAAPTNLYGWSTGGLRLGIGSATDTYDLYNALGDDFGNYPYGGWQNTAIDPEVTADSTIGGGRSGSIQTVCSLPNVRAKITKGSPHVVDAVRYGRGDIVVTGTSATFTGMASANDASTARWGLFQGVAGGNYLWKGLMTLGTAATSVTFSDSNKSIRVEDTPRVLSGFNKIEINNTSSSVTWSGISISGVQTSITGSAPTSPGDFEVVDNATIDFDSCTFTDMGYMTFNAGTNSNDIDTSIFRRCGLVTTGGASFDGCTFDNPEGTIGVTASSPANAALITNSKFNSDGTGNGLEITGTAADMTLTGVDFSGYSTTVDANKAIYVNIATGSMTINISGGSGVTADSHVRTAGCTVTVSADLSITISPLITGSVVGVYLTGTNTVVGETTSSGTSFQFAITPSTGVDIVILEGGEDDADASIPLRYENRSFSVSQTFTVDQLNEPNFTG